MGTMMRIVPPAVPPVVPGAAFLGALFLASLSQAAPPAAAAEAVVVASTAPGYAAGQVISDGMAVRLPDGANALFLFATGRTVTVKGPYEGSLDKMAPAGTRSGADALASAGRLSQSELG